LFKKCGSVFKSVNGSAKSWASPKKQIPITQDARQGDVFTIYNKSLGRIGHVGMVYQIYPEEKFFKSFEGNINSRGYRESRRSVAGCLIRQFDLCAGVYRWWR
jgi:hypothetical protein